MRERIRVTVARSVRVCVAYGRHVCAHMSAVACWLMFILYERQYYICTRTERLRAGERGGESEGMELIPQMLGRELF